MNTSSCENANWDFKIVGSAQIAHLEIEKGPSRFRPSHKRMGAAFTTISALHEGRGWKGHHYDELSFYFP